MNFYEKPEDNGDKTSKFNAAGLINATIENLWRDSYIAMANGNYQTWNHKLDAIWCILGGDVKKGKKEDKWIYNNNLKIHELGSLSSGETIGFGKKINENRSLQYLHLQNKSLYLRRLQNKQGKGTAYDDSGDEDDFE